MVETKGCLKYGEILQGILKGYLAITTELWKNYGPVSSRGNHIFRPTSWSMMSIEMKYSHAWSLVLFTRVEYGSKYP